MQFDRRGLPVTSDSAAAVAHLDDAIRSLLGHRGDVGKHLEAALASDADLPLGHILVGFCKLLLGRGELFAAARCAAERTRMAFARRGGTQREAILLAALERWIEGDMEAAASLLQQRLLADPLDALAFKLEHGLRFMLGDATGMRLAAERALPAWRAAVPDSGFILGCHAFTLEETGELGAAERAGRTALEREPQDMWGCHAVAHTFEMRGEAERGIAWLAAHEAAMAELGNFVFHLHWHGALFHLATGDARAALALYDTKVRAQRTDDYRDVANAASLLWRLENEGVSVGARWEELADIAEQRITDGALAFAQLHYLLCLTGAGRAASATALLEAMRLRAVLDCTSQGQVLQRVGVPFAEAIFLAAAGEVEEAASRALPAHPELCRVGGSRAQRDLFERILIEALIRGRRDAAARQLLDERLIARPRERWASHRQSLLDATLLREIERCA